MGHSNSKRNLAAIKEEDSNEINSNGKRSKNDDGRERRSFYDDLTYLDDYDDVNDKSNGNWYQKAADSENHPIKEDQSDDDEIW